MMESSTADSKHYIYNGGQVKGHELEYLSAFDQNATSSSDGLVQETNYLDKACMMIRVYDNNNAGATGRSVVDTVGVLGSVLKKYSFIKMNIAFVFGTAVTGGNVISLYDSLEGKHYTENRVAYYIIPSTTGTIDFTDYELPISTLTLDDNAPFYIGFHFQSGNKPRPGYQYAYINSIWLE